MVTANQLATYRRVQKRIEADFERDLRAIWAKASKLDPVRSARLIEQAFPALIDKYGLQAGAVAADWFESLTDVHATVPDSFKPEAFKASARWAVGERFTDTAESVAVAVVADRLVSSGVRHVRQHARDTIDASARNSGGRVFYARKVMGETCDFCLILASRGPVYGSETSARLRGADGNVYHDDCDCQVVPVKGEWVPDETSPRGERWVGQDPGYDFEKLYAEEYKPYWNENDNIKDVLKRKRAVVAQTRTASRGTKKPATPVTSGADGGKKPPTRKNSASGAFNRDENLVPKVKPSMFGSITVEPGSDAGDSELRVGQILSHRGKSVVHLRVVNEKNRSNPDITVDGEIWEIKSPKGATKRTIENQFKRAKKQSGRFVLDLSRCGIPDEEAIRQAERRFFGTSGFSEMIIIDKEENVYFYQREHGRV